MAEQHPYAGLNHGHAGILTYIPQEEGRPGPGPLHTRRVTSTPPHFALAGPTAEIYQPSRKELPEPSSRLWEERAVQRRWLAKSHPEAMMGNLAAQEFLKDDMERYRRVEEKPNDNPVLAMGQIRDLRTVSNARSVPVIASAAGEAGEILRITRLDETQWQWEDHEDATLNLSIVDQMNEEDEVIWMADCLPISRIKFASHSSMFGRLRWLMVQNKTSTTILAPEYHSVPISEPTPGEMYSHQRPSFIKPNALFTLHHHQTGGNAHSDVAFNPSLLGRPPQIAVIDECGYWSVWNILGRWHVGKNTLRLSQFKCGHIAEGILDEIPPQPAYAAEAHGILRIWKADEGHPRTPPLSPTEEDGEPTEDVSQLFLIWSRKRLEVFNLDTETQLSKMKDLLPGKEDEEQILDIQRSPNDENHVVVLSTRRVLWIDLLHGLESEDELTRPSVLLSYTHPGDVSGRLKMTMCEAASESPDTFLVFTYSSSSTLTCIYWFHLSPQHKLPQGHRQISRLFVNEDASSQSSAQVLCIRPAKLTISGGTSAASPGSSYQRSEVQFYQLRLLREDLSVRDVVCTVAANSTLDITLPKVRLGWSRVEQKRLWKKKRKRFLRHLGDSFALPDGMTDEDLETLLRRHVSTKQLEGPHETSTLDDASGSRFHAGAICLFMMRAIQMSAYRQEAGFPKGLFDAIRKTIAEAGDKLPLTTWGDIAAELERPLEYESPRDDKSDEVETLFSESDDKAIIMELRDHSVKELPDSLVSLSYLQHQYSQQWLEPRRERMSPPKQHKMRFWIAQIATDVLLSSYAITVQDIALFGPSGDDAAEADQQRIASSQMTRSTQSSTPSRAPSSSTVGRDGANEIDPVIQRLQLLTTSLESGPLAERKPHKVLSHWPAQRGVGTEDYMSSVAIAHDEQFREARERVQKMESKRKKQSEKYRRPAFMRQGFPADGERGEEGGSLPTQQQSQQQPMGPPPVQVMSSQQGIPSSSQTQGMGPSVTMSQPVAGAFGDRKKKGKRKRKSGFR